MKNRELVLHVMHSLPSDLGKRKAILEDLKELLPASDPNRNEVEQILIHLYHHELAQREFNLKIESSLT